MYLGINFYNLFVKVLKYIQYTSHKFTARRVFTIRARLDNQHPENPARAPSTDQGQTHPDI